MLAVGVLYLNSVLDGVVFCVELWSDSKIVRAVLKFGVAQWYFIGLEMGFTDSQIMACTFTMPAHRSKLQAIIELKVRECGVKETEKRLLTACKRIPQPIIGAMLENIEGDSGMSQCQFVNWFCCYATRPCCICVFHFL